MSQLSNDLIALSGALSTLMIASPGDPDLTAALAEVNAALAIAGSMDIIAMLPSDSDGQAIQAMLGKMSTAAAQIDSGIQNVTRAVNIGTRFATIVKDVSSGNVVDAVQQVIGLQTLVH